jgi:hypothetical protein
LDGGEAGIDFLKRPINRSFGLIELFVNGRSQLANHIDARQFPPFHSLSARVKRSIVPHFVCIRSQFSNGDIFVALVVWK